MTSVIIRRCLQDLRCCLTFVLSHFGGDNYTHQVLSRQFSLTRTIVVWQSIVSCTWHRFRYTYIAYVHVYTLNCIVRMVIVLLMVCFQLQCLLEEMTKTYFTYNIYKEITQACARWITYTVFKQTRINSALLYVINSWSSISIVMYVPLYKELIVLKHIGILLLASDGNIL